MFPALLCRPACRQTFLIPTVLWKHRATLSGISPEVHAEFARTTRRQVGEAIPGSTRTSTAGSGHENEQPEKYAWNCRDVGRPPVSCSGTAGTISDACSPYIASHCGFWLKGDSVSMVARLRTCGLVLDPSSQYLRKYFAVALLRSKVVLL